MSDKIKRSLENLRAAYAKLDEYLALPIQNDRDRSGVIKAFEFTFELVWKTFQKISQDEGLDPGGPKTAIKNAFKLDLIHNDEEALWLQMLEDRNLMSHTYRDELSKRLVERIQSRYRDSIKKVIERVASR